MKVRPFAFDQGSIHHGGTETRRKLLLVYLRGSVSPWLDGLLLYSFGDGHDPAFGIFEGEFAHAVELGLQRHDDFGLTLLHRCQDFFDPLDFDEQRQRAADGLGAERRIVRGDRFLIVKKISTPPLVTEPNT